MAEPIEEIKLYNSSDVETTDYNEAVKAEKYVDEKLTETANNKNENNEWVWTKVSAGGRKRRSFKKSKKGGKKSSKKSKKGGKKSKKTRRH
uniref:Uncharacterized protein n=1 Tax=viral metagenome TaxID=1070528 RepID=A0A6C0DEV6_9ZZZZ